jgi:hypothetical protein
LRRSLRDLIDHVVVERSGHEWGADDRQHRCEQRSGSAHGDATARGMVVGGHDAPWQQDGSRTAAGPNGSARRVGTSIAPGLVFVGRYVTK